MRDVFLCAVTLRQFPGFVSSFKDEVQSARVPLQNMPYMMKLSVVIPNRLTPWLMEPGGSMPHSQGLSNNSYPEPDQPNSPVLIPIPLRSILILSFYLLKY